MYVVVAPARIDPDRRERRVQEAVQEDAVDEDLDPKAVGRQAQPDVIVGGVAGDAQLAADDARRDGRVRRGSDAKARNPEQYRERSEGGGRVEPGQVMARLTEGSGRCYRPPTASGEAGRQGVRAGRPGLAERVRIHRPLDADPHPVGDLDERPEGLVDQLGSRRVRMHVET